MAKVGKEGVITVQVNRIDWKAIAKKKECFWPILKWNYLYSKKNFQNIKIC